MIRALPPRFLLWRSSLHFERASHDSEVLVAEPFLDDPLPFVGQAAERGVPLVAGCLEGEVHVLERERECELWRKLALYDSPQFGCLPRRHERAAPEGVDDRLGVESQPASKRHRRGNRLRREREPGVVHDLESCSGANRADPDCALTERVEKRSYTRAGLVGPGREDR